MFLTPEQLQGVLAIIDRHHNAFIANFVGPTVLPPEVLAKLEAAGLVTPKVQGIRDAYMFGVLAANLPAGGGTTVSYAQLADRLARNPYPLSAVEKQAISVAQMSAGQYISGLGARVQAQVSQRVMQADQEVQRGRMRRARAADAPAVVMEVDPATARSDAAAYKEVIATAVEQRKRLTSVVSDLGHATSDWCRDLERVATTEMATALQQGTANVIAKDHGDDANVAVLQAPNCCDQCARLYADEVTQRPKIFTLAALQANGSNYGRKAKEYRAIVPPCHINCACALTRVPLGMTFDNNNMMVPTSSLPPAKAPKT